MQKEIGIVYWTDDLSMFKILKGNREVKGPRKEALVKSIEKNGYIANPIIVNEKYEVIDGQGRLAACKEIGSPIAYTIVANIGIDECQVLNMYTVNWKTEDYIRCFAELGNENYIRLLRLGNMGFTLRTVAFTSSLYGASYADIRTASSGKIRLSQETFEKTKKALEYLQTVKPFTSKVIGRKSDLEQAVVFAYFDESCDNARLSESLSKYYNIIPGITHFENALEEVAKVYNRNLKGKQRLYLKEDYDRYKRDGT